jgi:hypothetical protein
VLGPAQRAVAVPDVDVPIAEPPHALLRQLGQGGVPLDGVDLVGDPGEHGRGIARAGAHLQDALPGLKLQGLGHQRHDVGLGDRLLLLDGERSVVVGKLGEPLGHEGLARHGVHGIQDVTVAYAPVGDLVPDHRAAPGFEVDHDAPLSRTPPPARERIARSTPCRGGL